MSATTGRAQDVEVVVVGGGLVGSAAAWHLALRGHEVVLLERFGPGHTRGASHGASRIFRRTYADPTYLALAREAEELWRELERVTGSELLTITGGVDHGDADDVAALGRSLEEQGEDVEWVDADEAADRWPGLAFEGPVLHTPGSGRLHADRSVAALQRAAADAGAVVRHHVQAVAVRPEPDHVVVETRTDSSADSTDSYRARHVVVAAGAWAPDVLQGVVPLPRIVVTQEQPAHFATALPDDVWPSFVHHVTPGTNRYGGTYGLLTPGEGVKLGFHGVGAVVHPDRRDFRPEPEQLDALREHARRWLPGVDADAFEPISCTYATSDDSGFVLDRHDRIVVAAGFSGHGFKFGPALGRVLADLVAGRPSPVVFHLDRPTLQETRS